MAIGCPTCGRSFEEFPPNAVLFSRWQRVLYMELVDGPRSMEQIFAKRFPGERMSFQDRKRIISMVYAMNGKLIHHGQHIVWKGDQYELEELCESS